MNAENVVLLIMFIVAFIGGSWAGRTDFKRTNSAYIYGSCVYEYENNPEIKDVHTLCREKADD